VNSSKEELDAGAQKKEIIRQSQLGVNELNCHGFRREELE
jgi:hypothetical protein